MSDGFGVRVGFSPVRSASTAKRAALRTAQARAPVL